MRPAPAIAAIGLALACGGGHAAGVFLPVGTPAPASQMAQASAREAHQGRFVRIAHNELQRAHAEVGNFGRSHLLLNISERLQLDVAVERTTRTLDGYTLSGHVDGGKGGFVTLAVHQQMVAGSIWTWDANYEVAPVGDGVQVVRQVMHEPVECGGVAQATSPESTAPAPTSGASDEAVVVDILVFWTPALEEALGEPFVKLTIDWSIAYTNDILERSGALVSLNLVGSERLDVEEVSQEHLFEALTDASATERADTLGADFVSLFKGATTGGAAFGPTSIVGPPHAYVFPHEIGHSLGVDHDRGAALAPGWLYNSAYVSIQTDHALSRCYITAVAYATACYRAGASAVYDLPYYSSPLRYHRVFGTPLGVSKWSNSRGWDGPADAVLAINKNRRDNSNIRRRPSTL